MAWNCRFLPLFPSSFFLAALCLLLCDCLCSGCEMEGWEAVLLSLAIDSESTEGLGLGDISTSSMVNSLSWVACSLSSLLLACGTSTVGMWLWGDDLVLGWGIWVFSYVMQSLAHPYPHHHCMACFHTNHEWTGNWVESYIWGCAIKVVRITV